MTDIMTPLHYTIGLKARSLGIMPKKLTDQRIKEMLRTLRSEQHIVPRLFGKDAVNFYLFVVPTQTLI